jgi:hypothetical protein
MTVICPLAAIEERVRELCLSIKVLAVCRGRVGRC